MLLVFKEPNEKKKKKGLILALAQLQIGLLKYVQIQNIWFLVHKLT